LRPRHAIAIKPWPHRLSASKENYMSPDLDPRKTALVLIDLQKGILGIPLTPYDAAAVMANALALGKKLKAAGGIVVAVNVDFAADGADRPPQEVDAPMQRPAGGMPADWAVLAPDVAALADVKVTKRQWGAFHGTELDLQLRRRGITTIILGGIATNFGVESTAREAWQHNYQVIIAEDACTGNGEGLHAFAIEKIFPRIARVRKTSEILAAVK
jgi:nicotinamidase-related amidase